MRTHTTCCLIALVMLLAAPGLAAAQAADDRAAITAAALDYIEGFYTGDPARMERSLHPDLAKRIVNVDSATGRARLDHMGADRLVAITRSRQGAPVPSAQQKDVTIFDVFGNAATAKVVANDWIDYLHLSKIDGRWVIVNVLWEMKRR